MKHRIIILGALIASLALASPALATDEPPGPPEHVVICHVAGLASDPANYVTLDLPWVAVYGEAGHFFENGTPRAGHEQDTLGACNPPPPPHDECPNIPGDQPEGYDCNPPVDHCPTLPGVQAEDEDCPPPTDVCPNFDGIQTEVPNGFALIDGECRLITINPLCAPPQVLDPLTGLCVSPPGTPFEPPTTPRCPAGMTPTKGKDGAAGNDECEFPKGAVPPPVVAVTVAVAAVATPTPAASPPAAKPPVVKPKPKPKVRKPAAKPKKKTVHKCVPLKDGTKRVWVKSGPDKGCNAVRSPEPENLTG